MEVMAHYKYSTWKANSEKPMDSTITKIRSFVNDLTCLTTTHPPASKKLLRFP